MIITHSSLECFKCCRRKFHLRYMDGIIPRQKSEALEFGSAMHACLESYFNRMKAMQIFDGKVTTEQILEERMCCRERVAMQKLNKVDSAKLLGLMLGYVTAWYKSDFENYEVVEIEKEFTNKTLLEGITYVGKVDGILKIKDTGKYYILEHKTASTVDDNYIAQKDIDSQTMSYAISIENELGIKISGVIHDLITKQKIRMKKGESEDDFCERLINDVTNENFTRVVIEFEEGQLDEFKQELIQSCDDLNQCHNFYKCTGSCIGRYGACEYLPLCRKGGIQKLGGIFGSLTELFETARAHEEISEETLSDAE